MELRHLRYFVAIGEEENYRRAAQRLNVAQTALSTQIQVLVPRSPQCHIVSMSAVHHFIHKTRTHHSLGNWFTFQPPPNALTNRTLASIRRRRMSTSLRSFPRAMVCAVITCK